MASHLEQLEKQLRQAAASRRYKDVSRLSKELGEAVQAVLRTLPKGDPRAREAGRKLIDLLSWALVMTQAGSELRIALSAAGQGQEITLLLEEKTDIGSAAELACGLAPAATTLSALSSLALENYRLTPRESDVLAWLGKGKTNRDIADILGMSPRTVNKHLEHIFVKLGVETRSAAAVLASAMQSPPARAAT